MLWIILSASVLAVIVFLVLLRRYQSRSEQPFSREEPTVGWQTNEVVPIVAVEQEPEEATDDSVAVRDLIALRIISELDRPYAGYELLQSLLSAGFRFGEMNIFHRYERPNGQGDVLFSLASASEPGIFDIQNMGSCSCRGLTLFMQFSSQNTLHQAFELMIDTARQLVFDLGGEIWDDKHRVMDQMSISHWQEKVKRYEASRYSYDLFED